MEIDRIIAHTYSSLSKSVQENQICPRHKRCASWEETTRPQVTRKRIFQTTPQRRLHSRSSQISKSYCFSISITIWIAISWKKKIDIEIVRDSETIHQNVRYWFVCFIDISLLFKKSYIPILLDQIFYTYILCIQICICILHTDIW